MHLYLYFLRCSEFHTKLGTFLDNRAYSLFVFPLGHVAVPLDVMAMIVNLTNATHEAYFGELMSIPCILERLPVLEIVIEVDGSGSNGSETHTLEIGPEYYVKQYGTYCTLSFVGYGGNWIY